MNIYANELVKTGKKNKYFTSIVVAHWAWNRRKH